MQALATRPWATTAVALAGAGMIAAGPALAPPVSVSIPDISAQTISVQLLNAADVVIDFIRHGESLDNVASLVGTVPPGAALNEAGVRQAEEVAQARVDAGDFIAAGQWVA